MSNFLNIKGSISAGKNEADISPLFDESQASETTNFLTISDLSDGNWLFKNVYGIKYKSPSEMTIPSPDQKSSLKCNASAMGWVEFREFTVSEGKANCTSGSSIRGYTMDDENKAKLNAFAAEHAMKLSWEGDTASIQSISTSNVILTAMFGDSKRPGYIVKKNAEGNRFIVEYANDKNNYSSIYYLMKK